MLRKLIGLLLSPRWLAPCLAAYAGLVEPAINRAWGVASVRRAGKFAKSAKVHGRIKLLAPSGLEVGEHVRIGTGCLFHCGGGITIGDNTQISRHVVIYSCNHDHKGSAIPYDDSHILKPVRIGRSVWIGVGVHIRPGVTVGDGAIIGMGTVVTGDVAPGEAVVAPRHASLAFRDMERFAELDKAGRHFGALWQDL